MIKPAEIHALKLSFPMFEIVPVARPATRPPAAAIRLGVDANTLMGEVTFSVFHRTSTLANKFLAP